MSKTLGGSMQVWDVVCAYGELISFKVVLNDQSNKDWLSFIECVISENLSKEYWFVEKDEHGVNHIKSKFKWGKH